MALFDFLQTYTLGTELLRKHDDAKNLRWEDKLYFHVFAFAHKICVLLCSTEKFCILSQWY